MLLEKKWRREVGNVLMNISMSNIFPKMGWKKFTKIDDEHDEQSE